MSPTDHLQPPGSSSGQPSLEELFSNVEEILPGLLRVLRGEYESAMDPGLIQTVLIQTLHEESVDASLKLAILKAFVESPLRIPEGQGADLASLLDDENPSIRCGIYRLIRDGKITIEPMELIAHVKGEIAALARCYGIEALAARSGREAILLLQGWQRDVGVSSGPNEDPDVQAIRAALGSALSALS